MEGRLDSAQRAANCWGVFSYLLCYFVGHDFGMAMVLCSGYEVVQAGPGGPQGEGRQSMNLQRKLCLF